MKSSKDIIQKPGLAIAAILLLSLPLLFFCLGGWGFVDPDEGRYGQIPHQMLMNSDFITPRQNELKFFDKPPLLYWGIATSYSIFGVTEWAARLVPALAALMGMLTVYALGRRMFGSRAGILGAVVLATSALWPVVARIVVTDMLVSSLVFGALSLWWMGYSEKSDAPGNKQTAYFLGFWAILALGVLAKGPIAVVLTGGCIVLYLAWSRQWRALSTMRWSMGIPLFFAIAAPWYFLVAQRNPEFNHYFWYDQHIGRFLGNTTGNDHVQSASYYFKFLPLVFFPWSVFVPAALFAGWSRLRINPLERTAKQSAVVYLGCGVIFTTLFFSASSGKLLTYILPIMPLLALLLGAYFDHLLARRELRNRAVSVGVAVLAGVLIVAGAVLGAFTPSKIHAVGINQNTALSMGLLLVAWAAILVLCARRFGVAGIVAGTAGGFTTTFAAAMLVLVAIMPGKTTKSLVEYIRPGLASHPEAEVLSIGYIQSVPFYAGQRSEILGASDEIQLGVAQMSDNDRRLWIFEDTAKLADLKAEMLDPYPVYCFVGISKRKPQRVQQLLRKVGNGATPIVANEEFLVFGNRAAVTATPPRPNGFQG